MLGPRELCGGGCFMATDCLNSMRGKGGTEQVALYALQVLPGCEAEAAALFGGQAEGVHVSVPCSEFKSAQGGASEEVRPMAPGFLLLEAPDIASARKACRRARGLSDLRNPSFQIAELSSEAAAVLLSLCGQEHVAPFSEGSMASGNLEVKCGALAGREGLIGRVSNRRKCAYVPVNLGNATVELQLGLRITRKS